jgi:hypothetical protein
MLNAGVRERTKKLAHGLDAHVPGLPLLALDRRPLAVFLDHEVNAAGSWPTCGAAGWMWLSASSWTGWAGAWRTWRKLVAELAAHGVALVCTSQGIDTGNDNSAGRLQLGVLMAVAEFERAIIRERVNAGLRAAKERGVRLGRPATNGVHAEAVRRLRAAGMGIRAIARELGLPVASVHKLARQTAAECQEGDPEGG